MVGEAQTVADGLGGWKYQESGIDIGCRAESAGFTCCVAMETRTLIVPPRPRAGLRAFSKVIRRALFVSVLPSILVGAVCWLASSAYAAVPFAGGYYEQNFNSVSLGTSGWVDNSTVAGWYARRSDTHSSLSFGPQVVDAEWASDARAGADAVMIFGPGEDRSLGAYRQFQDVMLALVLQNTSGNDFESFTLQFTGEQWRRPLQNRSSLVFTYALINEFTGGGSYPDSITPFSNLTAPDDRLTAGGYFREPSFDVSLYEISGFNPHLLAGPVDGNSDAYRANYAATVSNTWGTDDYLILRWYKNAGDGEMNDAVHLAVDDVRLTATVPEPSTYALLIMTGAGALWWARRRR